MSQSVGALEFIFNTKAFTGLKIENIMYFSGVAAAEDGSLPLLLTQKEMAHLELAPNSVSPTSHKDKNAAIKERTFFLNEEQRQRLQEYQLNQLTGLRPEQKDQLIAIKKEFMRLLFSEANKSKTQQEKAAYAQQKKALFESIAAFTYGLENNGDLKEHAQKLEQLFPSMLASAFYMGTWLATHQNLPHPLHDLCMAINFPAPPTPKFPAFKDWEPHATQMFSDEKLLAKYTRYYPILLDKCDKSLSDTSADDFASIIDKEVKARELREVLPIGETLSEVDETVVKKVVQINIRFKRAKYEDLGKVLGVIRQAKNSDALLPDITMTSEDLDLFEGLTMRKLDMHDPSALLFGHLTGCCQRIGGQGETCAIHSVTSDKGGVYVLEWKKTIMAGSWAWYDSEKHTLCFDSVEIDSQTRTEVAEKLVEMGFDEQELSVEDLINVLYTEFAQRLIEANPDLQQVLVGTNGQTPAEMGLTAQSRFDILVAAPDGYPRKGYRDSRTVRVLGRKDEVMYQLNALNEHEIIEKLFKGKSSSEDFFRTLVNFLNDKDLVQEYFIGAYNHIKTVTTLPVLASLDRKTIYLIKDANNEVTAHFYLEGAEQGHWEQKTFAVDKLPPRYNSEYHSKFRDYATIEFFEQVTSLCGLPSSRIKSAGIKVPAWFKFLFNKGLKSYRLGEIQELVALVNDARFIVPGTSETLAYASLAKGGFATVRALKPTLTKEIIDIGNEEESCLVLCAKKIKWLSPQEDWYQMAIELLDMGGDPNYGDVNGDGFAHHVCALIETMPALKVFLDLSKRYQFDLNLPNDDEITPLQIIAKNLKINTLSKVDEFFAAFAQSGISHKMDYLSFSRALRINNNPEDLGVLQEFLKTLDFLEVNKDDIQRFFANPSICHEAKVVFFEWILEQFNAEETALPFEKLAENAHAFDAEDLRTYLSSLMVKNIEEYEQLERLFKKAHLTCEKSLYAFSQSLDTSEDELIRLNDYMKQHPPSLVEFKLIIDHYISERFANSSQVYSVLHAVFAQVVQPEEQLQLFRVVFSSDTNQENQNGSKNDVLFTRSFLAYLKESKFPSRDNLGREIYGHFMLLKMMKTALTPSALSQMMQLLAEEAKRLREDKEFSSHLLWFCLHVLSRPDSDVGSINLKSMLSKKMDLSEEEQQSLLKKFAVQKDQKFSASDFFELEALCFAVEVAHPSRHSLNRDNIVLELLKILGARFCKNGIVLEEHIFDALFERYQVAVHCLNKDKSNPLFEAILTNLILRSALSSPERRCDGVRKVLEEMPVWNAVTLDSFDELFDDNYFLNRIALIELSVNFYLLAAQSRDERKERCSLLLDKFKAIDARFTEGDFAKIPLALLCKQINNHATLWSQTQSVGRNSFFQKADVSEHHKKTDELGQTESPKSSA